MVYPDTSTPSLPLCLEVCVGGGGSRYPQPVTNFFPGIPPLLWWHSGRLVWSLEKYTSLRPPRPVGGYIMGPSGPSGGGFNRKFVRNSPLFSRSWTWYSCHHLLFDIIFWSHGGNCCNPPTSIPFSTPRSSTKEIQETHLVLRQPPLYQVVLHKVHVHSPTS